MLKLNSSYSKKVPVPGQDFSSQSYHASVEVELSDTLQPDEIKERIHRVFRMVRSAVEEEIKGTVAEVAERNPVPQQKPQGKAEKATNKQIKFLTDLARAQGISVTELNSQAQSIYGVQGIYDLSKRDCSKLLDSLKSDRKAA